MKVINAIALLTLLSSLTICPANKHRKLRVYKRPRTVMQRDLYRNQDRKKTLCTPDVMNLSGKIAASIIQGGAIIIGAVLRALIDK